MRFFHNSSKYIADKLTYSEGFETAFGDVVELPAAARNVAGGAAHRRSSGQGTLTQSSHSDRTSEMAA